MALLARWKSFILMREMTYPGQVVSQVQNNLGWAKFFDPIAWKRELLPFAWGKNQIEVEKCRAQHTIRVLIVGGGTAGITVAAILKRRAPGADIAIVEPSSDHYYQPAFTLVGAGVYPLARTRRAEEGLIPVGVRWIHDSAQTFEPEKNTVHLKDDDALTYDYLVVCTGVKLDWGKIAGLAETLGKNGVCSNYSPFMSPTPGTACKSSRPAAARFSPSRRCRSSARARRRRSSISPPTIYSVRAF